MLAKRKVKCYGVDCVSNDIKHYKEDMKQIGGKNYCRPCYRKYYNEISERDKLYKYVSKVYGLSIPTPLMKKHINELREQWTYREIYAIIKYNVDIEKNVLPSKYGLRYYSNNYQEAFEYYKKENRKKSLNKGKSNESQIIYFNENRVKGNRYKDSKFIDMNDL